MNCDCDMTEEEQKEYRASWDYFNQNYTIITKYIKPRKNRKRFHVPKGCKFLYAQDIYENDDILDGKLIKHWIVYLKKKESE